VSSPIRSLQTAKAQYLGAGDFLLASPLRISYAKKRISIAAKPRNHRQLRNYSEVHRAKSLVGIADALHQRPERRLQKI
jgi:hypothetical protein